MSVLPSRLPTLTLTLTPTPMPSPMPPSGPRSRPRRRRRPVAAAALLTAALLGGALVAAGASAVVVAVAASASSASASTSRSHPRALRAGRTIVGTAAERHRRTETTDGDGAAELAAAENGSAAANGGGGIFLAAATTPLTKEERIEARKQERLREKMKRAAARRRQRERAASRRRRKQEKGAGKERTEGRGVDADGIGNDGGDDDEDFMYVDDFEVYVWPLCGEGGKTGGAIGDVDVDLLSPKQRKGLEEGLTNYFQEDARCRGEDALIKDDIIRDLVVESVDILEFEAAERCVNDGIGGNRGLQTDTEKTKRRRRRRPVKSVLKAQRTIRYRCRRCGKKKKEAEDLVEDAVNRNRRMQLSVSEKKQLTCPVNLVDAFIEEGLTEVRSAEWRANVITVTGCNRGDDACLDPNSGCRSYGAYWCAK